MSTKASDKFFFDAFVNLADVHCTVHVQYCTPCKACSRGGGKPALTAGHSTLAASAAQKGQSEEAKNMW